MCFADIELMKNEIDKDPREGITGVTDELYKARVREKMAEVGLIKRGNQHKSGDSWQRSENTIHLTLICTPKC